MSTEQDPKMNTSHYTFSADILPDLNGENDSYIFRISHGQVSIFTKSNVSAEAYERTFNEDHDEYTTLIETSSEDPEDILSHMVEAYHTALRQVEEMQDDK